jgi:hypothetical protein
MPYYIGAGMPEWDEHVEWDEGEPPVSHFTYIEPWEANTTVLPFPEAPGPEPEVPQKAAYSQLSQEQWIENYKKEQRAISAYALWKVSGLAATCRALGVKRVFGSYDGGGDEGFTYFRGVEMRDGRVIPAESFRREGRGDDCEELTGNAVYALMGTFDAGEFILHGVVIVDVDACTITDEKNADVVFGGKMPWEV